MTQDTTTALQRRIGVTGIAAMGRNLARNIAPRGFTVAVHNRTAAEPTRSPRRTRTRARSSVAERWRTSPRSSRGRAGSSSWSRPARPPMP